MLATVTAHVHIADGMAQQSSAPGVAVFAPPRRAERTRAHDQLYVLLELSGPGPLPARPYRELVALLAETYYATTGSVTAALRAAIQAANERLLRDNMAAPAGTQVIGGALCAALRRTPGAREEQLFLAQAGRPVAYLAREGLTDRFPAPGSPGEERQPLGISAGVDVRFGQETVTTGDVLFLSESHLLRLMTDTRVGELIGGADADEVAGTLRDQVRDGDLAGLVVAFGEPEPEPAGQAGGRRGLAGRGLALPSLPGLPALGWPRRAAPGAGEAADGAGAAGGAGGAGGAAPTGVPATATAGPAVAVARGEAARGEATRGEPAAAGATPADAPHESPAARPIAALRGGLAAAGRGVMLALSRASAGAGLLIARTLPEPAHERRLLQSQTLVPTWLVWIAAILVPVAVATLTVVVWFQQGQAAAAREAVTRAHNAIAAAEAAGAGPDEARFYWQQALAALDEAETLGARGNEVISLRQRAQAEIDRMDQVTRLQAELLRDFGPDARPERVIVHNLSLFTLEAQGQRVYGDDFAPDYLRLQNPQSEPLLFPEQQIDGRKAGEPIDMAWLPAGGAQRDSVLVVLNRDGVLFDYAPAWGGWRSTALVGANEWGRVQGLTTYLDRLYLLDPPKRQLWRYEPSQQGFLLPPSGYFLPETTPDLTGVVDFAIDTSGNLYLVRTSGAIEKYFNGAPSAFEVRGVPEPISGPSALFVGPDPLISSLYIAEPGARRIVRLSQGGAFLDQYRVDGPAFDDVRSFYVDEQNGRFYVASDSRVFVAYARP
jgi:hypothetical protein